MRHALLDLLHCVGLAAPAVDLRPARDARLDPVAREIAFHNLLVSTTRRVALERVRARSDQRQISRAAH